MSLPQLASQLEKWADTGVPGGGEFIALAMHDEDYAASAAVLLIWNGFLPMGGFGKMLGKLHFNRCVLAPADVHIGKKVRRKAKSFSLTVNTSWDQVLAGIEEHTFTRHKGDNWLTHKLAKVYQSAPLSTIAQDHPIKFFSIELWHIESGKLAAGEIGYTCGSTYSSCTGFAQKDQFPGSGTLQLAALGRWLAHCGFILWDLGMYMEYKAELGVIQLPRKEWVKRIRSLRFDSGELVSPQLSDACVHSLISGAVGSSCASEEAVQVEPPETAGAVNKSATNETFKPDVAKEEVPPSQDVPSSSTHNPRRCCLWPGC